MKRIAKILLPLSACALSILPISNCSKPQSVEQFTVTFETFGGSTIEPVKVDKDSKLARPDDPTRQGFEFLGWYKEPMYKTVYNFDDKVTSSFTLYAKWKDIGTFDGRVTQEQWTSAINQIIDYDIWNYSYTNNEKRVTDGEVKYNIKDSIKFDKDPNKTCSVHSIDTETQESVDVYFKKHEHCFYEIGNEEDKYISVPIGVNINGESLLLSHDIWLVKDLFQYMPFDEQLKAYVYTYQLTTEITLFYEIKFNSDYKVSNVVVTEYTDKDNYEYNYYKLFDYGTTLVSDFPFNDDEVEWEKEELVYDSTNKLYTCTRPKEYSASFIMNEFTVQEDFSPTELTLNNGLSPWDTPGLFYHLEIYVNDVKSNCTLVKDELVGKVTISNLDLKQGDKVWIIRTPTLLLHSSGAPCYITLK